jgi:hypothetical protein
MTHQTMNLDTPARYRVCVRGYLERSWSRRLGGMEITTAGREDKEPVTTLDGWLVDQAALLGVLNALYGMHLPLLSVEFLAVESGGSLASEPASEPPVEEA